MKYKPVETIFVKLTLNRMKKKYKQIMIGIEFDKYYTLKFETKGDKTKFDKQYNQVQKGIAELRQLEFVKQVTIIRGIIRITFKPTFIKFDTSEQDSILNKQVVHYYIPELTIKIDKQLKKMVYNNVSMRCHPHVNVERKPCFGHGPGSTCLQQCLSLGKFGGFGYMIWQWIHTYRPDDAYISPSRFIEIMTENGIPVFIDGKKVLINVFTEKGKQNEQKFKNVEVH